MRHYTDQSGNSTTYTSLWSKYRPALLKLMVDSEKGPQQYKFSSHEIKAINVGQKGSNAFTLKIYMGKAVNDIRTSAIAKDLLLILQESRKAIELAQTSAYEFTLDKHFVLHVTQKEMPAEVVEPVTG
jgi:hypothetical protein